MEKGQGEACLIYSLDCSKKPQNIERDKLSHKVAMLVLLSAVGEKTQIYSAMPITPQARRPPAFPVFLLSSLPPLPRSSAFSWI